MNTEMTYTTSLFGDLDIYDVVVENNGWDSMRLTITNRYRMEAGLMHEPLRANLSRRDAAQLIEVLAKGIGNS